MKGAMGDTGDVTSMDFLANEAIEAAVTGGVLMHVEADDREALQFLAGIANVDIQPLN
jgi:hypothetical protein